MKAHWIVLLLLPNPAPLGTLQEGAVHDRAFWRAIVANDYRPAPGADVHALWLELNEFLDAPDAQLRDDFGYGISTAWVYRQRRFDAAQLGAQVERLRERLGSGPWGIEEGAERGVLGRSFAALNLSILVARDLQQPYLNEPQFDALLSATLDYLKREADLRGWTAELGWVHATAHSADLLKFLARHPKLDTAGEHARVFQGLAQKIVVPNGQVFVNGEDERIAQAVLALLGRDDFEIQSFDDFLRGLRPGALPSASGASFSPGAEAAKHNAKHVLRALLQFLRAGALEDIDRAEALEARILGALAGLA